MSRPYCTGSTRKRQENRARRKSRTVETRSSPIRASARLIEQTRQLMERSIEFVPNAVYEAEGYIEEIEAIRPSSLDEPIVFPSSKPGIAFVSGLVDARLFTAEEERYLFVWMNFLKSRAEQNRRILDLRRPDQALVNSITSDLETAILVRNQIVQGNVRLVVAMAKKLSGSLDQMSELIGEGMSPLLRSVELFNVHLGNRFSTYATWAVRNQMLRWLKRSRLSRESLTGEDTPSLENLPDKKSVSELTESVQQMRMEAVNRLLTSLPEREREIVMARFGLDGQPRGQSLADIAVQVGLSKERVRQIVLGSISKLRELMSYDEFESMS